jgi:hypothetical protein
MDKVVRFGNVEDIVYRTRMGLGACSISSIINPFLPLLSLLGTF